MEAIDERTTQEVIFYWFHDDDHSEEFLDIRLYVPENEAFINLEFDTVGEVYESKPHPVSTGNHIVQLQAIPKSAITAPSPRCSASTGGDSFNSARESAIEETEEIIIKQFQLLPFEVTPSRSRIIVKINPEMKTLEIPWSKHNGISISASGEVKWDRNNSHTPRIVTTPPGGRNSERISESDPVSEQVSSKSSINDDASKPVEEKTNGKHDESIEEILKKFSHLSSLPSVVNGLDVLNGSLTESFAQLPGEENGLGGEVTQTTKPPTDDSVPVKQGSGYTFQNPITPRLNGSTSGCVNSANTSRTQALLEENVCKLEKVKEQQANEIIVLKTKLLEAERKLRENKEVIQQKTERESRYQSLHDENDRLSEELRNLRKECDSALTNSTAAKLATAETTSLAIMKRLEYLEGELRETRKQYESAKHEVKQKSRECELLRRDNEKFRKKLESLGHLQDTRPVKLVDFVDDPDQTNHSLNSARSERSERSNDTMRNTESTVFKDSPTHQLSNDENFTSNNLRFLRDRLSELRNKNENLQRKYNQVQNSFEENLRHSLSKDENQADSKHSKESESPRHLDLEEEEGALISIFDETDREIESMMRYLNESNVTAPRVDLTETDPASEKLLTSSSRRHHLSEKDKALNELEELRSHLAAVRAQVKCREESNNWRESVRSEAIGKLKKPSELFASLDFQNENETINTSVAEVPSKPKKSNDWLLKEVNGHKDDEKDQNSDSTDILLRPKTPPTIEKIIRGDTQHWDTQHFSSKSPRGEIVQSPDGSRRVKQKRQSRSQRARSVPPGRESDAGSKKKRSGAHVNGGSGYERRREDRWMNDSTSSDSDRNERNRDRDSRRINGFDADQEEDNFQWKPNTSQRQQSEMQRPSYYDPLINKYLYEDKENRVESWRNSLRGVANAERDSFYDKTGSAQLDHDQHSNSAALKDYDDPTIDSIWHLPSSRNESSSRMSHGHVQPSASMSHLSSQMNGSSKYLHGRSDSKNSSRPNQRGRPYIPRNPSDMQPGDRVKFSRSGGKISQGIIKYVGKLPSRTDYYLGVELLDAEGKHDGIFQDHRYFTCAKNKGVFVSFKKIVMCYTLME